MASATICVLHLLYSVLKRKFPRLAFLSDIRAEVRWIKSLNHSIYLFVGCRLHRMSIDVHQQLASFVDAERMARGQYD